MVQITLEYMIMIPLMILQIFLFPYVASLLMNNWTISRETLQLQETASDIGSSIGQLYSALNHGTISAVNVSSTVNMPKYLDDHVYTAKGTLRTALDSVFNSTKILDLTLTLNGTNIQTTTSVILGPNVGWINSSVYISNSNNAAVLGQKFDNGTINLSFTH
jgi:hypothetical protein